MRYLLDTHVLLWAINSPERLAAATVEALTAEGSALWFSVASYWEICIKQSLGKLRLAEGWPDTIERALKANDIQWLPIQTTHCRAVLELDHHHRDPFDRMLVAQALVEDLVIATSDRRIQRYPVQTL
jgi:PIN domain nuclease of toxin-antitoxin system